MDRLRGDVVPVHEGRVHRGEVEFPDVLVHPRARDVGEPPLVGHDEVDPGLELLGLPLLVRHQDPAPQGGGHLHRGDRGPRRGAGDALKGDAGKAGELDQPRQAGLPEEEGVAGVHVPAAGERVGRGEEDHPAVGKVRPLLRAPDRIVRRPAPGTPQGKGDPEPSGQGEQARQEPVVPVLGDEQVGVGLLEEPQKAPQELRPVFPLERAGDPVGDELQRADPAVRGVPGPLHPEQGRRKGGARRVHVPRGVEKPGGTDRAVLPAIDRGPRQGVEPGGVGELLLGRDIRVEQRFRPERLFRFTDGGAEEGRRGDRERPRRDRPAGKELGALAAGDGTAPGRGDRPEVRFPEVLPREDEGWTKGRGQGRRFPSAGAEPHGHPAGVGDHVEDPSGQDSSGHPGRPPAFRRSTPPSRRDSSSTCRESSRAARRSSTRMLIRIASKGTTRPEQVQAEVW